MRVGVRQSREGVNVIDECPMRHAKNPRARAKALGAYRRGARKIVTTRSFTSIDETFINVVKQQASLL